MATIDELRARAELIAEEQQIGGNTAERVGDAFDMVADIIEAVAPGDQQAVLYNPQSPNEAQKAQARENIGAQEVIPDIADFVKVSAQTFTAAQKQQARENIGAEQAGDAVKNLAGSASDTETRIKAANNPNLQANVHLSGNNIYVNGIAGGIDLDNNGVNIKAGNSGYPNANVKVNGEEVATKLYVDGKVDDRATSIEGALALIEEVIPSQASSQNQLADKNFVNSSISSSTANFVGTFNSLAELQAVQNPTNNDYGFVIETDAVGNEYYDRYKYNGTAWLFEYKVESTPFTSAQWAAIQSGITSALVGKLSALPTNAELTTSLNAKADKSDTYTKAQVDSALGGKQNVISDLDTIRSGATAGATAVQPAAMNTALAGKQDTLTFDSTPTASSTNPVTSGGVKSALDAKADKSDTYTKVEIGNLITPIDSEVIVGALPASGMANKVYRVPGTNSYTDYGWDGTQFVPLATYANGIADTIAIGATNLVKSGGIASAMVKMMEDSYGKALLPKPSNANADQVSPVGGSVVDVRGKNFLYVKSWVPYGINAPLALWDESHSLIVTYKRTSFILDNGYYVGLFDVSDAAYATFGWTESGNAPGTYNDYYFVAASLSLSEIRLAMEEYLGYSKTFVQTASRLEMRGILLKKGMTITITREDQGTGSEDIMLYATESSYSSIGSLAAGESITHILEDDKLYLAVYNTSIRGTFKVSASNRIEDLESSEAEFEEFKEEYLGYSKTFVQTANRLEMRGLLLKKGMTITIKCDSLTADPIDLYMYSDESTYIFLAALSAGESKTITLDSDQLYIAAYSTTSRGTYTVSGHNRIEALEESMASIPAYMKDMESRVLIIGDSYSAQGRWVNSMRGWLNVVSLVNLAVSSAKVKDGSNDRTTYPYSSRPISSDNSTNKNTFMCQVEKLKRLMAGVDLDAGESQIYTDASEYPNVIIIEGGQNDAADSTEKEATYYSQFRKIVNAYRKRGESGAVEMGDVALKTPLSEVDRTCFAGAYRCIIDELHTIFPNAQFFITSHSQLSYMISDSDEFTKIVEQQRKSAAYCGAVLIDWFAESGVSYITDYISGGTGTESDPYVWSAPTLNTTDGLHPNDRGGEALGHLAAIAIRGRFLNIG